MKSIRTVLCLAIIFAGLALSACGDGASDKKTITIYCAWDDVYSRPIIEAFEKANPGYKVDFVPDQEANKTSYLVTRIIEEKANPVCDVFWNNECGQSLILKSEGLLDAYKSSNAEAIPAEFKDADGYWTGFGARARCIIYNSTKIDAAAAENLGYQSFVDAQYKGKAVMATVGNGTTATHLAALRQLWGKDKTDAYVAALLANDVTFDPAGNAAVAKRVSMGDFWFGWTDTDDYNSTKKQNDKVGIVFPKSGSAEYSGGTLVLPNTVMLIKGAPNPEGGKLLIDWILRAETEKTLADGTPVQAPLHPGVDWSTDIPTWTKGSIDGLDRLNSQLSGKWEDVGKLIREYSFVKADEM
ncbi:MAG: extracellular solute-binding protein, partial [Planctomycetes bacterium]|nr:extracellular solute-binding protein [Planctomycetota bacterium]